MESAKITQTVDFQVQWFVFFLLFLRSFFTKAAFSNYLLGEVNEDKSRFELQYC